MADGGEKRDGDYITFRELVEREEKLRASLKADYSADMNNRMSAFGHEVAKQFVEAKADIQDAARIPQQQVQDFKQQLLDMAKGNHGWGAKLVGIGIILLGIGVILHVPIVKSLMGI